MTKTMRIGGRLVEVRVNYPWYAHMWWSLSGNYKGYAESDTKDGVIDVLHQAGLYMAFTEVLINQIPPEKYRNTNSRYIVCSWS